MSRKSVCIIGAGPCGIFAAKTIGEVADVVVYERSSVFGGQWAFGEESLADGERIHSSQYSCLWINGPQEAFELPNHRFPEGTPSYIKRPVVYKYLKDYIEKYNIGDKFKYSTTVENVTFNENEDNFTVVSKTNGEETTKVFDYVVVATGHFSWPHNPSFNGEETFPGKVMHAHDYADGKLYKDKRVLCIGGSYSSEDIALQCWKFGSKLAHITHRAPANMGFNWPEGVIERPILTKIDGSTVTFKDGSSEDYDVIIKCTGYLHYFPFMSENLTLKTRNRWVPDGLWKQCVLMDNPKVFYMGMQDQFFTFSMFQLQGFFARDVIAGKISIPDKAAMQESFDVERELEAKLSSDEDMIRFQANYVNELAEVTGEEKCDTSEIFIEWEHHKHEDILTYRDKQFKNFFTGRLADKNEKRWIDDTDP